MIDDPAYTQIVNWLQANPLAITFADTTNPCRAAYSDLCVALTNHLPDDMPEINAFCIALRDMIMQFTNEYADIIEECDTFHTYLHPLDDTLTKDKIMLDCYAVVHPSFTDTVLTWAALDHTVALAAITQFVTTQIANHQEYVNKVNKCKQALTLMSNAVNGETMPLVPNALKALLAGIKLATALFGKIGKSPGQEFKESEAAEAADTAGKKAAGLLDSSGKEVTKDLNAEIPTPPPRPANIGSETPVQVDVQP